MVLTQLLAALLLFTSEHDTTTLPSLNSRGNPQAPPQPPTTTPAFNIAGFAYNGGGRSAYASGELPTAMSTLEPQSCSLAEVTVHFPGYWGATATNRIRDVWCYDYSTAITPLAYNTSTANDELVSVRCLCIRNALCTCDKNSRAEYFRGISPLVATHETFGNVTQWYINGTWGGDDKVLEQTGRNKNAAWTSSPGMQLVGMLVLSVGWGLT